MIGPRLLTDAEFNALKFNGEAQRQGVNVCPTCEGKGEYEIDHEVFECPDDDYGHPQLRLARLYWAANLGRQYYILDWETFPHIDIKDDVDTYLANFERLRFNGTGMTFSSEGLGTGKTWVATHILKEVVKAGYNGWFMNFFDLKNAYEDLPQDDYKFMKRMVRTVEALVIDDVREGYSDAQKGLFADRLEEVVRTRQNANLPTLMTTNLTEPRFEAEYPRVYSLLAAKNYWYDLPGSDARRTLADMNAETTTRPIT